MGIIRESEANAKAKEKKVVNVKKEDKAPIVFNQGDDSVEPIDEGSQGAGAGSSVAQITGENFAKLMEAFIASGKLGRDGKIAHVVSDALEDINNENCTPEAVIEALRATGLDFIADAFVRVSNGDDIDTVVSETVVDVNDKEEEDDNKENENGTGDGAPAGGDSSEEPAPEETPANEEAPAESPEPAEKRKPGRPKNSDKK